MTASQRIQLRQSEVRQRLSALSSIEEQTEETRSELDTLTAEWGDLEKRFRAAIISEDEEREKRSRDFEQDPAHRELRARSSVSEIFEAALEHRGTTGATHELQTELGLGANQVPLALLRSVGGRDDAPLETRAVTPAPAEVGQDQQSIIPYVFPMGVAAFLGVHMPEVGVGETVFPVLTSQLSVEALAENAAGTETTGAFSADVLSPSRLQASFFYSREDRARFREMDAALRMNLSEGLADGLDRQIMQGTEGLLTGTNLANHNVTAVTAFADYVSDLGYGRVDGRYAGMTSDLRIVMGSATYAHAGSAYRGNNSDENALDRLMAITSGIRVSAHVPAVASNKQNVLIRLGMRRDMCAPVWEGVTLIPDEVTKAANGQIVITAVMLYAVKILRSDGFYKQQTQHA